MDKMFWRTFLCFFAFDKFMVRSTTSFIVSETRILQRPEKYLGDLGTWEKAETSLTEALNEFGKDWQVKTSL